MPSSGSCLKFAKSSENITEKDKLKHFPFQPSGMTNVDVVVIYELV